MLQKLTTNFDCIYTPPWNSAGIWLAASASSESSSWATTTRATCRRIIEACRMELDSLWWTYHLGRILSLHKEERLPREEPFLLRGLLHLLVPKSIPSAAQNLRQTNDCPNLWQVAPKIRKHGRTTTFRNSDPRKLSAKPILSKRWRRRWWQNLTIGRKNTIPL